MSRSVCCCECAKSWFVLISILFRLSVRVWIGERISRGTVCCSISNRLFSKRNHQIIENDNECSPVICFQSYILFFLSFARFSFAVSSLRLPQRFNSPEIDEYYFFFVFFFSILIQQQQKHQPKNVVVHWLSACERFGYLTGVAVHIW